MFERFTDRARRVLVLAQEEARLLHHDFLGTEHILLGLVGEGEGVAAKALASLGVSLDAVREKVVEMIGPVSATLSGAPPFTPRSKKVLELALREALQLQHNYIGTEHLLLGLVREGEGVAAQVLVSLGADLSRVRQQVMELLSAGSVHDFGALAVANADMVEKIEVGGSPTELFGWGDVAAVLAGPPLADARTRQSQIGGVLYDICTYKPLRPPEISLAVARARVSREAFDAYTRDELAKAEAVEDLGDAATYGPTAGTLRVLAGSTAFVVRVSDHPLRRDTAIAVARRVLQNLAGSAGAASPPPSPTG